MPRWIDKKKYLKETGNTDNQFYNWCFRCDNKLVVGVHYRPQKNSTQINQEAMDKWWDDGGPNTSQTTTESQESESKSTGSMKRLKSASIQKVVLSRRQREGTGSSAA